MKKIKLECCGNKLDEKSIYVDGGFAAPGWARYEYYFVDGDKIELKGFDSGSNCPFCVKAVKFQFGRLITKKNKYDKNYVPYCVG